jgi:hypothetical protein
MSYKLDQHPGAVDPVEVERDYDVAPAVGGTFKVVG